MQNNNNDITTFTSPIPATIFPSHVEDYAELLQYYSQEYKPVDYYYQIGETDKVQGWILHISVVISQITDLLTIVIPVLVAENVPFKMAMDKEIAKSILGGNLGIEQLGKVISIYPNDNNALSLAVKLVKLTQSFKGPVIPTDIYLGGTIYTRYGSIRPIILSDTNGKRGKYIYDFAGQLIKDPYDMPFQLPQGIKWPYDDLADPVAPIQKKILKNIYKPLTLLKEDIKGNVYKGIFFKGFLRITNCVIKEGKNNVSSDDHGRDMHERLVWQYELHQDLKGIIPIPAIYDLFKENGNTYLVMEFIEGISLNDYLSQINLNIKSWSLLTTQQKITLLDFLLQIISIISELHQKGYIHRDIAPGNFIINQKGNITLIDMELAYSNVKRKPDPAFILGTPGYISPEQQESRLPTIQEDFYGLGALMATLFTGLYPTKFDIVNLESFAENLYFFIGSKPITHLIAECMNKDPSTRPNLSTIQAAVEKYKLEIQEISTSIYQVVPMAKMEDRTLEKTIEAAIEGLVKPPIIMSDDLWCSKLAKNENGNIQKEYTCYGGLHEGMGGVLYLLARAQQMGHAIDPCRENYFKGWEFIEQEYFHYLPEIAPGLYGGSTGLAVSLKEGIKAGLLPDNEINRHKIVACFSPSSTSQDVSTGIAGLGIASLQCNDFMNERIVQQFSNRFISKLLDSQQKDGSWLLVSSPEDTAGKKMIGFGNGIAGITWFLLEYIAHYKDHQVQTSTLKALNWLLKTTHNLKGLFKAAEFKKILQEKKERGDERKGIILTCIKAYEILQDKHYKQIAEEALLTYPKYIIKNNFSLDTGLAGLGEIYLEAFRVFKNEEWQQRAAWIAQVYLHTYFQNPDGSIYWKMNEMDEPTADLMTGTCGIIHFLLRYCNPEKIGYRILK